MASVALIGPDGAGKTTLTRMLEESGLVPVRYLYMGVDISASNVALPTSRLAEWVKRRLLLAPGEAPARAHRSTESAKLSGRRSRVRAAARLANRLGEEWYRQLVSWYYQLRGYVVLYDRHFLFDYAPEILAAQRPSLEQRIHSWCLNHLYPRPDLVIFLDAPGQVLFARKGESTVAELERRRQGFLRQAARFPNFVRVDATRPLQEVYGDITAHVLRLSGDRGHRLVGAAR